MEYYIEGTYVKTLFFDAEKGRSSFLLKPNETADTECNLIKVVGKFCLRQKGIPLCIKGKWQESEYGKELHLTEAGIKALSEETTEKFLRNLGIVLSESKLKRLLKYTGMDIFGWCEKENAEVEIALKTKVDLVKVVEIFSRIRSLLCELALFKILDQAQGNYEHVTKILKKYPDNALELIEKNAYQILEKTDIPLAVVDRIALNNGVEPLAEERVKAILLWIIKKQEKAGNVYTLADFIYKESVNLLGNIPQSTVWAALKDHPDIMYDERNNIYYEKSMLMDEQNAAKEFCRILDSAKELPFCENAIERIEKEHGYKLGSQQKSAFQLLHSTGIKLLTGDPGTGKTTTVNVLLHYLEIVWNKIYHRDPVIALCAPSGRAAQRMKETTGRNSLTIHKLIEYQPYGALEYYKNSMDPIDADVIIVDEVSMLGLSLFCKLLGAVKNGSLVLMVGDVNQLQSVEPGNVLQDLIDCGYVDRCHLTEVFRQGEKSLINQNAKKIMEGNSQLFQGADFSCFSCKPEDTQKFLLASIQELRREVKDPEKIQVLTPMRKGSCGVRKSNEMLQEIMNPGKGGIYYGFRNYKLKDRVIMLNNNYAYDYYNGDVGYIKEINPERMIVCIGDHEIIIPREHYGDLDLAYACTIHKSQGSEYGYLVIVLQEEAAGMLDRNLLYTAVTRGKKKVIIIYENNTMDQAVRTYRKEKRNSLLSIRIDYEMSHRKKQKFSPR